MQRRRHFYPGSPLAGSVPRRDKGIPGAWAILFVRAVVDDPAGCDHPSPALGAVAVAFRLFNTLGTRNADSFRGYLPTAHTLTYLRFAESVTVSGARLATDRAGSPLAERVSHPLDDKQGFMKSSHTPILLDQPCLVALKMNPRILIGALATGLVILLYKLPSGRVVGEGELGRRRSGSVG